MKNKMESRNYWVYALSDPRTYRAKYIGVTKSPMMRYYAHRNSIKKESINNRRLIAWLLELDSLGLEPELVLLGKYTHEEAIKREKDYITLLYDFGQEICNVLESGNTNKRIQGFFNTKQ